MDAPHGNCAPEPTLVFERQQKSPMPMSRSSQPPDPPGRPRRGRPGPTEARGAVGRRLRALHSPTLAEPLSERLTNLLAQLEVAEKTRKA
jgi:hypothetical protein